MKGTTLMETLSVSLVRYNACVDRDDSYWDDLPPSYSVPMELNRNTNTHID